MEHNARIAAALADLRLQTRPNFLQTARAWEVERTTLAKRYRGETASIEVANSESRQRLSNTQEECLIEYINKLSDRGFPPTPQILKNIAESVAKSTLGKNWVARFCRRHHDRIKSIYLRGIDHRRKVADNSVYFQHFYDTLRDKLEKYHIDVHNIYNVDEKGFLLGLSRSTKRIVPREHLKKKQVLGSSQDGSRDFVTLIAAICTDGTFLPPAIIYQGRSHDLQDTWLEAFDVGDQAFFASSENGWSDDTLGLDWLQRVFDRSTKAKLGPRDRRLLLVDGHNSHVNLPFIEYADQNRILLAVLPPHSTHRLQPLDIGLFAPLATYYSQAIDQLFSGSHGLISLTKRDFWPLFHEAWEKAFCAQNIRRAWEAAGIYPLNPRRVITHVNARPATPERQVMPAEACKTPKSLRSYRRSVQKVNEAGTVRQDIAKLLRAGEKFATDLEIARHEAAGLRQAVIHEKTRRRRGRAMHLYEEGENAGQARFFSPERIARARERTTIAETADVQRRQEARERKLQQAAARSQKARDVADSRLARRQLQASARAQQVVEKAQKQAVREARRAERAAAALQRREELKARGIERLQAREAQKDKKQPRKRPSSGEQGPRLPKRLRGNSPTTPQAEELDTITVNVDAIKAKLRSNRLRSSRISVGRGERSSPPSRPKIGVGRFGRVIRGPAWFGER